MAGHATWRPAKGLPLPSTSRPSMLLTSDSRAPDGHLKIRGDLTKKADGQAVDDGASILAVTHTRAELKRSLADREHEARVKKIEEAHREGDISLLEEIEGVSALLKSKRSRKSGENDEGDDEGIASIKGEKRDKQSEGDDESESEASVEDDSDSSSDEDDSAELLRELERIKQQRREEEKKQEEIELRKKEQEKELEAIASNPLLRLESTSTGKKNPNFRVQKRWDDDVVFRNQALSEDASKKSKRFINDTLRNDFHRSFLNRFVK